MDLLEIGTTGEIDPKDMNNTDFKQSPFKIRNAKGQKEVPDSKYVCRMKKQMKKDP